MSEGNYGVALLNDGKYGHSLHHNTLGLSLLKGAIHPDPDADRGMHRFTYSLLPHAGVRRSSFVSTPTDHIVVETIKVAEDGDGLIIRLYEAHNKRGLACLVFASSVISAVEVDLLERMIGPVSVADRQVCFNVRPFEVKTLRVRLAQDWNGMFAAAG